MVFPSAPKGVKGAYPQKWKYMGGGLLGCWSRGCWPLCFASTGWDVLAGPTG